MRPLAEEAFVRGREVGLAHDTLLARLALDELLRVDEVDVRDRRRGRSGSVEVEQRELALATAPASPRPCPRARRASTAITREVVVDEAELDVERHVLGEVADGVVRFGAEHRADLVDALEHADHHLLVELRALREVAGPAEVVDAEHVGAGLGGRRDDLRRLDLDEAGRVERGAHARERERAEPEHRAPAAGGAARPRAWSSWYGSCSFSSGTRRLTGGGSGVAATQRERRVDELDAAGRLRVQLRRALDLEHRLVEPLRDLGALSASSVTTIWHTPLPSRRITKSTRDERPVVEQPALEFDPLADVLAPARSTTRRIRLGRRIGARYRSVRPLPGPSPTI